MPKRDIRTAALRFNRRWIFPTQQVLTGQQFSQVGSNETHGDSAGEQGREELSGFFRLGLEMLQVGAKS